MDTGDNILSPIEHRPTILEVDLDALTHNFSILRSLARTNALEAQIMPVVKANAYGHGIVTVSRHLEKIGANALAVAFVEEGVSLRKAGIKIPILVLGGMVGPQTPLFLQHDLDVTASSISKLEQIEKTARELGKRARVHLKIDTGMERVGVHWYSATPFIERALSCDHIDIVGIYSHFAKSESDVNLCREQLEHFLELCAVLERSGKPMPLRHIGNSGSLVYFPESTLDLVRPGLALYGITPGTANEHTAKLKPVLSLHSQIVYFKVVKAGNGVSYGHTWTAKEDTRVVTVPVGYGDGFPRRLSNRGTVLIRGKRYPIIGNVCMDMLMVDIGKGEAYVGDPVVLCGRQGEEEITANAIADLIGTTPHEIVTAMNLRIPRRYVLNGQPVRVISSASEVL